MLKIGVTGGIGSGKTTVCRLFGLLEIPTYYADQEARRLMQENDPLKHQLSQLFGTNIYVDGKLDRPALASIVFNDPEKLKALNELVHPAVHHDFQNWARSQEDKSYVLEEAALIFESGGHKAMDKMLLITAPVSVRIERVMNRNQISAKEVQKRIDQQWTDEVKLPKCDFVIINDGQESLIRQVMEVHSVLTSEFA